jgi:hypothetical protein
MLGCILFAAFALSIGAYDRTDTSHPLSSILTVSSSAGELLKFSLDDSPLLATAAVATAVPLPQSSAFVSQVRRDRGSAMLLLGCVFSLIVAFNLAFVRHLRRVYASPR